MYFFSFSCAKIYMSRISCKTTHPLHISRPTRLIPFFNYNQGSARVKNDLQRKVHKCISALHNAHPQTQWIGKAALLIHQALQIRAQYNFQLAPPSKFFPSTKHGSFCFHIQGEGGVLYSQLLIRLKTKSVLALHFWENCCTQNN